MAQTSEGFWFKSNLFQIEPGEDELTNPGIYGKQFAAWVAGKLKAIGYSTEAIAEDFGWCVICARDPFRLWIACGNITEEIPTTRIPSAEELVWHCYCVAEAPFFKGLFRKVAMAPAVAKLDSELKTVLSEEKAIQFVPEP